jgi:hypothetical protein
MNEAIEKLERLERLVAAATKIPWEVETEHDDDAEYGSGPDLERGYDNFIVFGGNNELLFGTATSDAKCIVEEPYGDEDGYVQAWDQTGKANAELIVAAVNALPALLAVAKAAMPFAKIAVGNEHLPETVFVIQNIPLADARTLASRLEAIGK